MMLLKKQKHIIRVLFPPVVTLPKHLQILPVSPSKPNRRSMQLPYRLPNPLPPLPVRKGVRGRRPKSETIALLKAVAEAAAVHGGIPDSHQLVPRPHKKRGPKPGSKVRPSRTNPPPHLNPDRFTFDPPNPVFQRKPKILQSPAQVPNIQLPHEGPLGHSSVVSTGSEPHLPAWLHLLCFARFEATTNPRSLCPTLPLQFVYT